MNQGSRLFDVQGIVRDITNMATVDTAAVMLDGKRVSLNLKDRVGVSATDGQQGFILDTQWMGRGQNSYISRPHSGRVSGIALIQLALF